MSPPGDDDDGDLVDTSGLDEYSPGADQEEDDEDAADWLSNVNRASENEGDEDDEETRAEKEAAAKAAEKTGTKPDAPEKQATEKPREEGAKGDAKEDGGEKGEKGEKDGETSEPPERKLEIVHEDGERENLTREEVVERIRAHRAAEQDFETAARKGALAQGILERMRDDPMGTILEVLIGANGGSYTAGYKALIDNAKAVLKQEVEFQGLPPEEQVKLRMAREIEEKDRQLAEYREREESRERDEADFDAFQRLSEEITPALKAVDLPTDGVYLTMVAERLNAAAETGRDLSVQDAARQVRREVDRKSREMLQSLPLDHIISLRPDLESEVKKRSIEKVQASRTASMKPATGVAERTARKSRDDDKPGTYRDDDLPW